MARVKARDGPTRRKWEKREREREREREKEGGEENHSTAWHSQGPSTASAAPADPMLGPEGQLGDSDSSGIWTVIWVAIFAIQGPRSESAARSGSELVCPGGERESAARASLTPRTRRPLGRQGTHRHAAYTQAQAPVHPLPPLTLTVRCAREHTNTVTHAHTHFATRAHTHCTGKRSTDVLGK